MTTLKAQNMEKEKQLPEYLSAFPLGEENVQYARFLSGNHTWLRSQAIKI